MSNPSRSANPRVVEIREALDDGEPCHVAPAWVEAQGDRGNLMDDDYQRVKRLAEACFHFAAAIREGFQDQANQHGLHAVEGVQRDALEILAQILPATYEADPYAEGADDHIVPRAFVLDIHRDRVYLLRDTPAAKDVLAKIAETFEVGGDLALERERAAKMPCPDDEPEDLD